MRICAYCLGTLENHQSTCRYYKEDTTNKGPKFTPEQVDWICWQIGEWYLKMKPLLEGQHNLGYMKEVLKIMICGDE